MKYLAHKLVKETAVKFANEVYEQCMHDNTLYANWKAQCPELTEKIARKKFVALLYPRLLETARHTLATMLGQNYPESLKEEIADALVKDNFYREGRNRALAEKLH